MNLLASVVKDKRPTLLAVFLVFVAAAVLFAFLAGMDTAMVLASIGAFGTGIVLAWRLGRTVVRRSIWRLRNRLIMTYVFIGFVPLVLVLILVAIGGYIFAGQTAMYLVSSELDRTLGTLQIPDRLLVMNPKASHVDVLNQVASFLRQRFDRFEVVIQRQGQVLRYPVGSSLEPANTMNSDYLGLTVKNGQYYAWSHSEHPDLTVDALAPIDREMLAGLVPQLGKVELSGPHAKLSRRRPLTADELRKGSTDFLPAPVNNLDYEVIWLSPIRVVEWRTGKNAPSPYFLLVTTRPFALIDAVFGKKFSVAIGFLYLLVLVAILFFLVEIVSAIIGWSLARSITSAMGNLYDGTRRVAAGEFSHRIRVKGNDQLAAVSESFNSMTERLEKLVIVEKEKERLQSELEIAREVQSQLFPRSAPKLDTLEVSGICRPARMVSGDYYDFLCMQDKSLALAIGDVAGKGISAALLMASIQSIMRMQLTSAVPVMAATANGATRATYSTSSMVSQLNRQLYASTAPEKYATFMFGIYDEHDRAFTYTNAGHLPPILIRRGDAISLQVTGTVVGAFPSCHYEERKIHLERGDLLVSYTDGITEPENEYGEEFGEGRLVETLLKNHTLGATDLINCVMDAVRSWTTAEEMPDDMTIVLARRTA